jgi:cell division protein ZapE
LTLLVDVLYDQRVNLILSAEAPADQLLLRDGRPRDARMQAMSFQFDRTTSRLAEMQTVEYLGAPRALRQA